MGVHQPLAVVGGEIHGGIFADDRVEVQASSVVQGDITTQRIIVQEGGEVNGHVRMSDPQALLPPSETAEAAEAAEAPAAEAGADAASLAGEERQGTDEA